MNFKSLFFSLTSFGFRSIWRLKSLIRVNVLRIQGATIGKNVKVFGRILVEGRLTNLQIGDNVSICHGVVINLRDNISIGHNVHISPYVQLHTGSLDLALDNRIHESMPITIEDNTWLASGCIICLGCKVGIGSVVAANSVVTRDIRPNCLYGGLPAKFLKNLNANHT